MNKQDITQWLLARLKEKGTWRAIASLAGLFGLMLAPDQLEIIGAGIIALVSVIEMAKKEA